MALRDMSTAPSEETWIILRFDNFCDEPLVAAGFWGDDGNGGFDWYSGEAMSLSLTEMLGQPIGWLPLNGED